MDLHTQKPRNYDVIPFTDRNAIFARLEETASRLNMNDNERVQYNDELKKYRDYFNQIDYAKESGFLEGIEKGIEKGERNKQYEITASMKADGMSVPLIQKYTGLTAEVIMQI